MEGQTKKVVIIDYQLGNLFSVNQAMNNIGLNTMISSSPSDINDADAIILPGVGAFADAMNNLENLGLANAIKNFIISGKPFLGICLGLQLLFTESDEFGTTGGLNIISGKVKKFGTKLKNGKILKVPQIGWNNIIQPDETSWNNTPLFDVKKGAYMYFVHSYYVIPNETVALTHTIYGETTYVSSIRKENVFACQFHPEKSASEGLRIYRNWAVQNKLV